MLIDIRIGLRGNLRRSALADRDSDEKERDHAGGRHNNKEPGAATVHIYPDAAPGETGCVNPPKLPLFRLYDQFPPYWFLASSSLRTLARILFERRVQHRVAVSGVLFLAAMLVTGAGAFLSGNNLLFLIFAAMLALLLLSSFLSRLVLAGLELELLLPEHVCARTPAEARVRLRNLKRFTPSFSIELSGETLPEPVYFPLIPGHGTQETAVELVFPQRGRHSENIFFLSTGFPFGFVRRSSPVDLYRPTTVYPALVGDPATEALLDTIADDTEGHLRGAGREFYRIRAYVPSDEARHVDWKSTARTGIVQTREFARDELPPVEICLRCPDHPGRGSPIRDAGGTMRFCRLVSRAGR